ncbi:F-box/LRR-repeat protein At3g48880-like [Aristolochia californica]|uniref:F-box/LRR-repeat protein At3g48880-like n=1 Tax=Aristolochia californica TaxID=171875 RepID=UPI0035DBE6E6
MEGGKWEDMNMDCLINIFSRLGLHELTLTVPFVCRSWYRTSLNPLCWRSLDFHELDLHHPIRKNEFARKFMGDNRFVCFSLIGFLQYVMNRSCRSAEKLVFPCHVFTLEDFIFVSEACPALKSLTVHELRGEKQKHFQNLIGKWKELRHLKMAPMPWNLEEILKEVSKHCEHFMGLEMSGWMGWEQVSAIVTLLPKIRQLHLSESLIFKEHLLSILGGCRELEVLDVKDCWVDVDDKVQEMAAHIKRFECSGVVKRFEYSGFVPEEDVDNSHIYGLYNSDGSGEDF